MNTNQLLASTLGGAVLVAGVLAGAGGSLDRQPTAALTDDAVLAAYASQLPFTLAAPTWLPDGMVLLDGDGPWTRVDLDGDGTHESVRAEIMYGPPGITGMAPIMTSQESGHELSSLAGGYDRVDLPDGTPAWLTVREDSPWLAVQWNVGEVTRGIQATGVTVEELLRIAASFRDVT